MTEQRLPGNETTRNTSPESEAGQQRPFTTEEVRDALPDKEKELDFTLHGLINSLNRLSRQYFPDNTSLIVSPDIIQTKAVGISDHMGDHMPKTVKQRIEAAQPKYMTALLIAADPSIDADKKRTNILHAIRSTRSWLEGNQSAGDMHSEEINSYSITTTHELEARWAFKFKK